MTTRRGMLLPLALAPVAGWAVWRAGFAEPDDSGAMGAGGSAAAGHAGAGGGLHLGDDPGAALWRSLMAMRRDAAPLAPPRFVPAVTALEGQNITLRGFMLALDSGALHRRYLFAPNPPGCPGCQPLNAASLLDVRGDKPSAIIDGPVTLSGVLRLRRYEELVYRLDGAVVVG